MTLESTEACVTLIGITTLSLAHIATINKIRYMCQEKSSSSMVRVLQRSVKEVIGCLCGVLLKLQILNKHN
ncbi:hypothetical protein VPH5P1C_0077 [Vibrio phage 5P1c]